VDGPGLRLCRMTQPIITQLRQVPNQILFVRKFFRSARNRRKKAILSRNLQYFYSSLSVSVEGIIILRSLFRFLLIVVKFLTRQKSLCFENWISNSLQTKRGSADRTTEVKKPYRYNIQSDRRVQPASQIMVLGLFPWGYS
jgi:hypothetical protein